MDRSSFRRVETHDKETRTAFKEALLKRISSHSESYDPEYEDLNLIPIGRTVWHPNFGVGEVVSVDKKANEIVLDFSSYGQVSLVLSQVLSKLSPVEKTDELKPSPIKEVSHPQTVIQEKVTPELSVIVPEGFERLKEKDQFLYLKSELLLTVEEANDVIFVLKGKSPLYNKVSVERTC